MDIIRRDAGSFLLPALLVLLLALPMSGGRATGSGATAPAPSALDRLRDTTPAGSSGPDVLTDFLLFDGGLGELTRNDLRGYDVRHLILTLPDPLRSRFGEIFDRHLDAAQRALETLDYVLDRIDLPWLHGEGAARPGVLLFRREKSPRRLLVLLVVGETSTGGIQKEALRQALERVDRARGAYSRDEDIRIVGPTFTGSLASLRIALDDWGRVHPPAKEHPLRVVSGSVTGAAGDELATDPGVTFRTTLLRDSDALDAFVEYLLKDRDARRNQIAILTEGATGYGGALRAGLPERELEDPIPRFTFPLHVADLRSVEDQRHGSSRGEDLVTPPSVDKTILSLKNETTITETTPLVARDSVVSAERSLAALFQSLARDLARYIIILASDPKDAIYLVGQVRERAPNTLVVLFDADLLYLHSDVNLDLRGALTVSTYPLFSLNQFWSPPHEGGQRRLVFPSQTAQGVYNAVLAQAGDSAKLLEYGWPLGRDHGAATLPAWVQVVGREGFWPLTLLDVRQEPLLPPVDVAAADSGWREVFFRGLETRQTATLLLIVLLVLGSSAAVLISWSRRDRNAGRRRVRPPHWRAALLADVGAHGADLDRDAYRGSLLLTLLMFALVTIGVNLLPMISALRLGVPITDVTLRRAWWILKSGLLIGLLLVSLAIVTVHASRLHRKLGADFWRVVRRPILAGTIGIVLLCLIMVLGWCMGTRPEEQLFLYLRAVNWLGGASPVLPLFFLAVTGAVYLIACNVRLWRGAGVARNGGILVDRLQGPEELGRLESRLRQVLSMEPVRLPMAWTGLVMAGLCLILIYGNGGRQSYESRAFALFFAVSFASVYVILWWVGMRLHLTWRALQALLDHLGSEPWSPAFAAAPAEEKGTRREDLLAAEGILPALRRSVEAATALAGSDSGMTGHLTAARSALERARKATAEGEWSVALHKRRETQKHLAALTSQVIARSAGARQRPGADAAPGDVASIDRFLSCRVVELLKEVLPQMRLLLTCAMSGLLLMLLAVSCYPFQARDRFMLFNWCLILVAVALSVHGFVQMNRNPVLSLLTGTEPNQVTWNRDFIVRLVLYGLVPLLGLLGAQFPASVGRWLPIVNRLIGAQP